MNQGIKAKLAMLMLAAGSNLLLTEPLHADNDTIEEVVVTGARGAPRTASDSPVPIDSFGVEEIVGTSYTDTNNVLQTLVPSYNVTRQPISDGGSFIRPAELRGMPTDKTLVLVNSKRRHRAALVTIGGSGTQGPDVATIPASALKRVEVLRDGAAAQYGSDAIAGVINFILKDNREGGDFAVSTGEFAEGDGFDYTVTGNIGLPLGANGFLSISGEHSGMDFTSRSEQYCQTWFCLDQNNPVYNPSADYAVYTEDPAFVAASRNASLEGDVVQPWGQPNAEATRLFFNAGMDISDSLELYAFGNYSSSESDGSFFYRYPGNGTIEDLRQSDGSIYSPLEKFPGGFTPRFFGEVADASIVIGAKGMMSDTLSYDISSRLGSSEVEYTLRNTINPSMGAASPTSFKPGDLVNEELQLQADFVKEFTIASLASPLAVGFGFSYMDESYDIKEGEQDSYLAGPHAVADPFDFCNDDGTTSAAGAAVIANGSTLDCTNDDDPVYQVVGVGSNGFPGYSPAFSDSYSRDSYAAYVDVSADVTDRLFLQAALRYEDYSDFDSEVVYKLAAQYDLTDNWGIRGSIGTGFRAPTPGQQGTTNVSTRLPNGFPVATGLFPASSVVAQALGANALKPELSDNYSFGVTADFNALTFTVDFYQIDVQDRFYAISTLDVSTDPTSGAAFDNFVALEAAGVAGANSIGGVNYFQNAFDTETRGIDIVVTAPVSWENNQSTVLMASVNFNETSFASDPSAFLNAEDQFDFENDRPEWRGVITATHYVGKFTVMGRMNVYGPWANSNNSAALVVQDFGTQAFFDLEGSYAITEKMNVTLGGRNITDEYPEQDSIGDFCCGRLYPSTSVVDWQGSYYYARLSANF